MGDPPEAVVGISPTRRIGSAVRPMGALVTQLLQDLIRHDTVNPPGNERAAQERLADLLDEAGFAVRAARRGARAAEPGRRARGPRRGPDARLPRPRRHRARRPRRTWTRDPWSGDVADGFVWGRGALDMKSQVAAEVVAAAALARAGWRPARGELLVVVRRRRGDRRRARRASGSAEQHPDAVRCDYLLNEGGGDGDRRTTAAASTACAAPRRACSASRVATDGRRRPRVDARRWATTRC